jgi:energy-coupling factor transporter ATP-binding protein EcfA2
MSLYIEWLNNIKAKATSDWLTDNQRKVFDQILSKWVHQQFICLCGQPGSGKTFIAHLLSREHDYVYFHELSDVEDGSCNVLIDGEEYTRLMRDAARIREIKRIIILSRKPPQDRMPKAEIMLDDKDIRQFQHNLIKFGILKSCMKDAESKDFSQTIKTEYIARSEGNVD